MSKILTKAIVKLAEIFAIKHRIDSRTYRSAIYSFVRMEQEFSKFSFRHEYVSKIEAHKKKRQVILTIETHRVGLLIGKGGRTVDSLKEYVQHRHPECEIKIKLKECAVWQKMYKL